MLKVLSDKIIVTKVKLLLINCLNLYFIKHILSFINKAYTNNKAIN